MVLVCLGCVLYLCVIASYLNNMQIVVGVFGAEMAVSFRSSGVGLNFWAVSDSPRTVWRLLKQSGLIGWTEIVHVCCLQNIA